VAVALRLKNKGRDPLLRPKRKKKTLGKVRGSLTKEGDAANLYEREENYDLANLRHKAERVSLFEDEKVKGGKGSDHRARKRKSSLGGGSFQGSAGDRGRPIGCEAESGSGQREKKRVQSLGQRGRREPYRERFVENQSAGRGKQKALALGGDLETTWSAAPNYLLREEEDARQKSTARLNREMQQLQGEED